MQRGLKRSRFNNKANKSGRPADKTAYKTQRNLGVKLNKETKKPFLKNQITDSATKNKKFVEIMQTFFR